MNLKACCGLLASKEDEDHDYEDVDHKILPKPRASVERGRKGSITNIYANAGYFAKANSMAAAAAEAEAEAEAEASARRSFVEVGKEYTTERDIQKAAWEAGAAASVASGPPPGQRQNADDEPNIPEVEKLSRKREDKGESHYAKGGGAGASGVPGVSVSIGSISRETSGVSSFSSTNSRGYPVSHGTFGQGSRSISIGSAGGREGSKKWDANRSKAKDGDEPGQIGFRVGSGKGWNGAAGGVEVNGIGGGGYKRAPVPTIEAPAASRFDLAGFVSWLDGGVLLTKINRQGRAKVRTLFYDEQNRMLWWNGPGASGRFGSGSQRSRSSSLMSLRKEQPLPLASLLEVKMASQMDEPFCFDSDVDNSLQLVFPSRTVDLVAKNEEEAVLLARGFQELRASVA